MMLVLDSPYRVSPSCFVLTVHASLLSQGRRRAIILQTLPFLVGAAGMAVGTSFWLLLASRTVAGVGVGAASTLCNLYISEISPDASRGRFGAWAPFAVTFGILVSYVLAWAVAHVPGGPGVVWRIMLGLGGVPALVGLLASGFLVESPRWLLQRGRRREAVAVVTMLYEPHADRGAVVERVVGEMEVGLARQARGGRGVADSVETGNGGSFGAKGPSLGVDCDSAEPSMPTKEGAGGASQWERLCLDARNVKPMVIGVGLNVLQQVCGINVVVYFAPTVLVNAGFSKTASILLTAGVGVAQLVATYVLMQLVDRIGRRPLNFIGLVAMVGSLVLMAAAFFAPVKPLAISRWLAVFGMLVFRVAFSLSLGPLPYAPPRGAAGCVASAVPRLTAPVIAHSHRSYIITPELFPSSSRTAGRRGLATPTVSRAFL